MADQKKVIKAAPQGKSLLEEIPMSTRIADPIVKDPSQEASLLGEYGITGGLLALGGLISKAKFAPRIATKGLIGAGIHAMRRGGSKLGYSLLGGATGAAVVAPTAYMSSKAAEISANDKEFNPAHFAAITAPAVATGLLGYGAYTNIGQAIRRADKTGAKGMVKEIISPRRNLRYAKHGLNLAGRAFRKVDTSSVPGVKPGFNLSRFRRAKGILGKQWKGRAGGLLALGLVGLEAIGPGMYLGQTSNKKKDGADGRV